jgi:putative ABC transport system substrate-binding protein
LSAELGQKRLELLHEFIPTATVIALLVNPASPNLAEPVTEYAQAAARTLGLELHVLQASTERDFDALFATLVQLRAGALVIGADVLFNTWIEQLAALTVRHAVPTIYTYREFAAAGGLMSYGGNFADSYRQAGVYSGRILKGEAGHESRAEALGITFPLTLLGRADEVIE